LSIPAAGGGSSPCILMPSSRSPVPDEPRGHSAASADDLRSALLRRVIEDNRLLEPDHIEDLHRSGLTPDTIRMQRLCSVWMKRLRLLLGIRPQGVRSAMLIPFPDPAGGFMNHVRVKIFPPLKDREDHVIKYLQPRGSGVRLFFPLATLPQALNGGDAIWLVEGEKKALAVAQLDLPAVGFCGIEGWHIGGSKGLLPDFDHIHLRGRLVELVPDGDWQTNPHVERGASGLAEALEGRGARVRIVVLPVEAQS
jgi:hypothetical protein